MPTGLKKAKRAKSKDNQNQRKPTPVEKVVKKKQMCMTEP